MVEKTNSELVFFRFNTPAAGIWKIVVEPVRLIDGQFHMWLPVTEFLDGEVYFLESDPYYTLTNPANAPSPIIVSYYDGKMADSPRHPAVDTPALSFRILPSQLPVSM